MTALDYRRIPTEKPHPLSQGLDQMTSGQLFELMNGEDVRVVRAVAKAKKDVVGAVGLIVDRLKEGGRLFLVGAGTSGRLCVLEAAECPPTFNTPPGLIRAFMAGGRGSVFRSREGAEDQPILLRRTLGKFLTSSDVVISVAASGVTAFAKEGLALARTKKAVSILLTCNPQAASVLRADRAIVLVTGPEILTGSTRLKAGTATKMVLNMLTTMAMVRLGKVYGHWMVDLQPRSKKLEARAETLVSQLGNIPPPVARRVLRAAGGHVKTAILMARFRWTREKAKAQLLVVGGHLRSLLG